MKPIGYWLSRTDRALTSSMDGLLAEFGLTRIAWQVLNVVEGAGETSDSHVVAVMAAKAEAPVLSAAIDTALAGGWVTRPAPARLALTTEGRARLAEVAERVGRFRDLSTTGISPDEYRTAVTVLERITRNVEGKAMGDQ